VGVKEKVAPPARFPLLKVVPSSEVTVCVKESLFTQLTFVPTLTDVLAGKDILLMSIVVPPTGGGLEPESDLEQERKNKIRRHPTIAEFNILDFIKLILKIKKRFKKWYYFRSFIPKMFLLILSNLSASGLP
jgi:hypothetical protein